MNYYPFHIGDYISHTTHLSNEEDLAYRRMIDLYYLSEQPFNDCSTIARKVKTTNEIVQQILNEFFTFEDDGCWHNKRIDEEISKYKERLINASKAGKASAQQRLNGRSTTRQLTNNQEPITNNQNKKTITTPDGVSESVFQDYVKLRNKLKAPVTETAINGLKREAKKAGMNLEEVMVLCCQNGWRGFKSDWVNSKPSTDNKNRNQTVLAGLTRGLLGGDKNVGLLGE